MNVLIIGFGSIGKRHFSVLSKMKKIKNIKICTNSNISSNLKLIWTLEKLKNSILIILLFLHRHQII